MKKSQVRVSQSQGIIQKLTLKNCQINKLSKTTFETVLNIVLQVCPSVSPFVSELFTTSSNLPLRKKLFMKQGAVNKRIQNMLVLH